MVKREYMPYRLFQRGRKVTDNLMQSVFAALHVSFCHSMSFCHLCSCIVKFCTFKNAVDLEQNYYNLSLI